MREYGKRKPERRRRKGKRRKRREGRRKGGKFLEKNTEAPLPSKRREWTNETLSELQPPTDGIGRNYDGLLYNMRLYGIPPMEQYAIIRKATLGQSEDLSGKDFVRCVIVVENQDAGTVFAKCDESVGR